MIINRQLRNMSSVPSTERRQSEVVQTVNARSTRCVSCGTNSSQSPLTTITPNNRLSVQSPVQTPLVSVTPLNINSMVYDHSPNDLAIGIVLFAGGVVMMSLLASVMAFVMHAKDEYDNAIVPPSEHNNTAIKLKNAAVPAVKRAKSWMSTKLPIGRSRRGPVGCGWSVGGGGGGKGKQMTECRVLIEPPMPPHVNILNTNEITARCWREMNILETTDEIFV